MPRPDKIIQKLKGLYPGTQKLSPEILDEYDRVCGDWTDDEFDAALERYRAENSKGEFCPDAWRLKRYGPAGKADVKKHSQSMADQFFQVVEQEGWDRAVNNIVSNNCGPELKEYVISSGISGMPRYGAFGIDAQEYFIRLHEESDPIAACEYLEYQTNDYRQKEWWRKRKEYYMAIGLESAQKCFSGLRWKLWPGRSGAALTVGDLAEIFKGRRERQLNETQTQQLDDDIPF